MRILNRGALEAQKAETQPPWWLLLVAFVVVSYGAAVLWEGAFLVAEWVGRPFDPTTAPMRIGYFVCTLALVAAVSVGMLLRYRGALFAGYRLNLRGVWRILWVGVLAGLALLLYYVWDGLQGISHIVEMTEGADPEERWEVLLAIHRTAWAGLGWGTDPTGVVLMSIASFTVPFYEEWLFSGFIATRLARRLPLLVVVPFAGLAFLAVHIPLIVGMGSLDNVLLVFLAGCSSLCARLWCGSWLAGLVAHLIINFGVFLFKWAMAFVVFRMAGIP